jgi:tRNA (guanine-N(7)-)-methyltransferase subunit TRM82
LAITHAQLHVVAVTAEDKCIRVFSIGSDGQLEQLSDRSMPKRPCAIAFTPDGADILSADKFGDVYSLPLLVDPKREEGFLAAQKAALEAKDYVPAATELTVHSRANRKALESQLQQAKEKRVAKTKEPLSFLHKVLLGHVSMLTDMLVTTVRPSEEVQKPRTYILTADRDEHIRISRGPPQAYVIEGYCLGHHEFVNNLCLAEPGVLVSGGGDQELLVWDWLDRKVLNRINIINAVKRALLHVRKVPESPGQEGEETVEDPVRNNNVDIKIAVSGLWRFADSSLETVSLNNHKFIDID